MIKNNKQQHKHPILQGDSRDYDIITRAIERIPNNSVGMTCEIGLREGAGTGFIMDALSKKPFSLKVHIAIDPFGNLIYAHKDGINIRPKQHPYTNAMRDKSIGLIYLYAARTKVNFIFINLDDREFFNRYADGVPVYIDEKFLLSKYVFVHFDGPHQTPLVSNEFLWFNERMSKGATIVFDDVSHYDHDFIEKQVLSSNWKILEKTKRKISYQKQ